MAYIRLLHASPDAPAVDIYANGVLIGENISYLGYTDYLTVMPGKYNIQIYPANSTLYRVLNTFISVPSGSINTAAVVGTSSDLDLLLIPDAQISAPTKGAYVRFGHLSPNAPAVDITLPDGTVLFSNVEYKEVEDYILVDAGTYNLQVREAGTDNVVLNVPNVELEPYNFYSIYAVGLLGGKPSLEALLLIDG